MTIMTGSKATSHGSEAVTENLHVEKRAFCYLEHVAIRVKT